MTLTSRPTYRRRPRATRWVPAAAGWTVGIIATLSLIASVSPGMRWLIRMPREFVNDYIFNFPDTSFAWAFVLALLAAALAARKRIAWWILLALHGRARSAGTSATWSPATRSSMRGHRRADRPRLPRRGDRCSSCWRARSSGRRSGAARCSRRPPRWWPAWRSASLVGWGLLELFPGTLARDDRFLYALNRVSAFAGAGSEQFSGHPHVFVNALLGLFGALALMVAAIVLFRSQRAENALTGEDESAIRGLLELYGKNDSLGYFATRRDKSVVFAPNGRAAITYRVEVGVCLASGDPVGDPKAWPQAIDAWLELCQDYGWAPGVMGASSAAAQAFREAGLNALQLGDEAILHPDSFRLSGPDMRPVRQAVTRARRAGLTVRIRRHRDIVRRRDGPGDQAGRRLARHRDRARLLDGAGPARRSRRRRLPAGRSGAGRQRTTVVAMLSLVPWGTNGVSLDLMRRSPAIPQRHHRTDGQRAVPAVGRHWGQPDFAELRDVPVGVRAGRAARRRPGRAAVARPAGVLLALVAAGDAVPLEHEVPARVGAALRLLRGRPADPAGRRGVGHRRGLPGAAVLARATSSTPATTSSVPEDAGRDRDCCTTTAPRPTSSSCRPISRRPATPRLPEQVRVRMAKLKSLQDSGVDAYPVGQPPSHTVAQALDESDGDQPSPWPGACCASATTAVCCSPSCATGPAKSNCCSTIRCSNKGTHSGLHRTRSTSAT